MSHPPEPAGAVLAASFDLDTHLNLLEGMTPQARAQVLHEFQKMIEKLVREIQRVEFADRSDLLGAPEITATMVLRAAESLRPSPLAERAPRPFHVVALHATNLGCAALGGLLVSHLNSTWQWSVFVTCAVGSIAASSYLYRRRWQ